MGCAASRVMHMQAEKEEWDNSAISAVALDAPSPATKKRYSSHVVAFLHMNAASGPIDKKRKKDIEDEGNGPREHSVSLTSSTYGMLDIQKKEKVLQENADERSKKKRCLSSKGSNNLQQNDEEEKCTACTAGSESPIFDPVLLETIEKAFEQISEEEWYSYRSSNSGDPLESFKPMCPPGGEERAVLYYTSLRGVRKTHEECTTVMTTLRSLCVSIDERDVSMHQEFRKELRDLFGVSVPVPQLFIKGRYIGGAAQVLQLHDDGSLLKFVEGIPKEDPWRSCDGCGGARFILCLQCSGSCKILTNGDQKTRCLECNENGLIRCPICC